MDRDDQVVDLPNATGEHGGSYPIVRRVLLTVLVATSAIGCGPSFRLNPPPRTAAGDPRSACVEERAIALGSGSASYAYGGSTVSVGSPVSTRIVTVTPGGWSTSGAASGPVFYRGGNPLRVDEALHQLGDSRLIEAQRASKEPYASGASATWARPTWIALLTGGVALVAVGTAVGLSASPDPVTGATDLGPMLLLAGAGVGGMLASLPFVWLDMGYLTEQSELAVRDRIFVAEPETLAVLDQAIAAARDRAAAACDAGLAPR
jgi:hypothetical protein